MSYVAICCRRESAEAGLVLATTLRRMGEPVSLQYSGKLNRQFEREKNAGAHTILTIREDMTCRLWFRRVRGVETNLSDASHYLTWMAEEGDTIPDPPDYLIDSVMPSSAGLYE